MDSRCADPAWIRRPSNIHVHLKGTPVVNYNETRKIALREQRDGLISEAEKILDTAQKFKRDLSSGEQTRYDGLIQQVDDLNDAIKMIADDEKRTAETDAAFAKFGVGPGGSRGSFKNDGLDAGRRTIDAAHRSGSLPDYAAANALALIDNGSQHDRSIASQWAAATGDPAYARAFAKIAADPERGHLLWESDEQRAYQEVARVSSAMRGMSHTDNAGGYMVPLVLDPSILISNAGTTNSVVDVARVVSTVSESWQGVTSAGVTAEWLAESTEAADGTPTLASVPIPVHKGSAYVPYSYELGDDVPGFVNELQKVLLDAAVNLSATAYTTGSGTGQPKGFIKALDGTASEVAPIAAETFAAGDVYALIEALPPRFRKNATWMANLTVLDLIDQFETTNGAKRFPQVGADPSVLLRRPVVENSDMDGSWNTAATADNFILAVGDFKEFIIASRIGARLEFIPHVFGANNRPTGERGAHLWFRTGSDVSTINAFRLLNLATTA